jgi:hypothetical protein
MRFETNDHFTTKSIVTLCNLLEERFGAGHEFAPEPITEGGLKMTKFPGLVDGAYKTMRFSVGDSSRRVGWPWITSDARKRWNALPAEDLFARRDPEFGSSRLQIGLFLKAFHGAPCWTRDEIRIVAQCFEALGFVSRGKPPSGRMLESRGDLGLIRV